MTDTKTHLAELIRRPSLTPEDAGCQQYLMDFLTPLGFSCQRLDCLPVHNFFARLGTQAPLLVFAGHTDVVPVGNLDDWTAPPFALTERDGMLYGRGTADMKGGLACMMTAAKRLAAHFPAFKGSLGFLITSAEEGDAFDKGTPFVMQALKNQGIALDYCILGEPSSHQKPGDVIKIGRRGSLTGSLTVHGKQGHVAYPHLAINPIHVLAPALHELTTTRWDEGNACFPPTTLQITSIQAGANAGNVIPGTLDLNFNFRFSTEQTVEGLQEAVISRLKRHEVPHTLTWRVNGEPFLTASGKLLQACLEAVEKTTGQRPHLSTDGGTSDGRFIAPYGVEVIELGLTNATIHQVNECIGQTELATLSEIYWLTAASLLSITS